MDLAGRYEIRLNNKSLADVSDRLMIVDVTEREADESVQVVKNGYTHGSRLSRVTRGSLSVEVQIVIREHDVDRRMAIYQRVLSWARGEGWLTIGNRMGQRVRVERVNAPSMGSVKEWMGTITVAFTAYSMPFWENVFSVTVSVPTAGKTGSASILPPGNADCCLVDAEITAVGGNVNALTVTAGASSMTFASLGLTVGNTLKIGHTEGGLLTLCIGDISVMNKRTGESADELLLVPGKKGTVSFSAGSTCTAVFKTRGRWL